MIMFGQKLLFTVFLILFCYTGFGNVVDSTTIIIKVVNKEKPSNIYLNFVAEGSFFGRNTSRTFTSVRDEGEVVRLKTHIPMQFTLLANIRQSVAGIVFPGDSLIITCDYKSATQPFTFEGSSALACEYYSFVRNSFALNYYVGAAQIPADNFAQYLLRLEKQYNQWDSVFNVLRTKQKYPEWFLAYRTTESVYSRANAMVKAIHQHNNLANDKIYANPEFMLWFRDTPLNNAKAINNSNYFEFLWNYFLWKEKIWWVFSANQKVDTRWVSKILPDVKKELNDDTRQWFLTKVLVNYYNVNDVNQVDTAFTHVKPLIKNPHYLEELNTARQKSVELRQMRFAKSARVGSKAPGFYLKDSLNENYSIEKFKGQWVFIGFYNSAGFSANNFRAVKDSVSRNNKNVKLVNIYVDYDAAYWKKKIEKYPGMGMHLFCKGNWSELLTYLYGLESYPYYVLVDPYGIIRYSRQGNFSDAFANIKNE